MSKRTRMAFTPGRPGIRKPGNFQPKRTQPGAFTPLRNATSKILNTIRLNSLYKADSALRVLKKVADRNMRPKSRLQSLRDVENIKLYRNRKDLMNKNKPKTETVPLLDNASSLAVAVKGKMKLDRVSTTTTLKVDMSGPVKQRSFVTTFNIGAPTSSAIKTAIKLNGEKTLCLFNTMTDTDLITPTNSNKEYNEIVTGFNQKIVYTSKHLAPTWKSIFSDIYKITTDGNTDPSYPNPDGFDKSQYLSMYGCAKNVTTRITLRNNMNTTSAVVKVHLIALKDPGADAHIYTRPIDFLTATVGTNQGIETQRVLRVAQAYPRPYVRKAAAYVAVTNPIPYGPDISYSHAWYSLITPYANLQESKNFTDKMQIVKTFARTLDVGDDWVLNINRSMGSGLKLDEALRTYSLYGFSGLDQTQNPFGHRILIEVVGKKITAEAAYLDTYSETGGSTIATQDAITGEDKYIGTAPCSVSFESAHYITYALQSFSGLPSTFNETNFAGRIGGPLIRSFVKDLVVTNPPYNVDYWKTNGNTTFKSPLTIKSATTATVDTVTTTS